MGYEENVFIVFDEFSKKLLMKICSPINKTSAELSLYWAKRLIPKATCNIKKII